MPVILLTLIKASIFPVTMAVLEIGAAIVDFSNGNVAKGIYRLLGAGITITIIFT